jgi:hypothetical protein
MMLTDSSVPQPSPLSFSRLPQALTVRGLAGCHVRRCLQGGSTLIVRRVYYILHHILKELSSKRLAADQRAFAEVGIRVGCAVTCHHAGERARASFFSFCRQHHHA